MKKWVYYCERCQRTFEVEVEDMLAAAGEAECPYCEYPHATKAFPLPEPPKCAPGSGC